MSEVASIPQKIGLSARFLPAPLIQARSTVFDRLACLDLNRSARHAMYGLLAFFNLRKPDQPIWAYREAICKESLLGSVQTLYRALAELERHGYIEREQIRRKGSQTYGQYGYSYIWLTEKARALLGLPVPMREPPRPELDPDHEDPIEAWEAVGEWEDDGSWREASDPADEPAVIRRSYRRRPAQAPYPHEPSPSVRDRIQGSEPTLTPQLSRKEQPEAAPCEARRPEASGNFQRKAAQKSRLPEDVTPLLALGLSKPRICLLMREARAAGKPGRLGDAIRVAQATIASLRGTALFLYLKKMLSQPTDYGWIARRMNERCEETARVAASAQRIAQKSVELEGRSFASRDGQVEVTVQARGLLRVADRRRGTGYRPMDAAFLEALDEGRLVGVAR